MSATTCVEFNTTHAHDFTPTVFHYFKNEAITRSLVTGTKERALCGIVRRVDVATTGTLGGNSSGVICPLCQILMDAIKEGTR